MADLIIALVAFGASVLTFFSGFGLGTLLLPVFAAFFPPGSAVAITGIVHLLNNIFKFGLMGKSVAWRIILRFGAPAIIGAFLGAEALMMLSASGWIYHYTFAGVICSITAVKVVIAVLMFAFAIVEFAPAARNLRFGTRHLIPGGILSGFFGGLSGHQGALRSTFLIHCNLTKEQFIATGVTIACLVDLTRLPVYFTGKAFIIAGESSSTLLLATGAAFAGAYLGSRLLKQITLYAVKYFMGAMVALLALALGTGLL